MKILVATENENKLNEIRRIMSDVELELIGLFDLPYAVPKVIEDGNSFMENAIKKARETARVAHCPTIADDSGLCIDALNGKPGIFSARYSGSTKNDEENRRKVLEEMSNIPQEERGAQFKCAIAFVVGGNVIGCVEGVCEGYISFDERGTHGFGYDPIFYYPELKKTFAEISGEEKNRVSHRCKALSKTKDLIGQFLRNQ